MEHEDKESQELEGIRMLVEIDTNRNTNSVTSTRRDRAMTGISSNLGTMS